MEKKMEVRRVLDLRPDAVYRRHSEGDFLRAKNGHILFAYTRFFEAISDNAPSSIVMLESADEGESWSEAREIIRASAFGAQNVMSVSMLRMENGDLGLFYILKGPWYTRIMLSRSKDDGQSFVEHKECTLPDRRGWFVLNNSRVERLKSGRLIVPLAYHRTGQDAQSGNLFFDSCACVCILYSDDDGRTWQEAPEVLHPPFAGTQAGLQEPGVIELNNGLLWAYFRTDKMYQYEAFSRDSGLHWTRPQESRFTSPLSPMKICRQEKNGRLYAFWNPIPNYLGKSQQCEGVWHGGRSPLVYAMSDDEGNSWSEYRIIENSPGHGYCYPAVFFTEDGTMLAAYCAGGVEDKSCLARLCISKIAVE